MSALDWIRTPIDDNAFPKVIRLLCFIQTHFHLIALDVFKHLFVLFEPGRQGSQKEETRPAEEFLVCVHAVSPEIPYAILRVPQSSGARYVLQQALSKARSSADPDK